MLTPGSPGSWQRWRPRPTWAGLLAILAVGAPRLAADPPAASEAVFAGPTVDYAETLAEPSTARGAALRWLAVEERAGETRQRELVRVPVFFIAGECRSFEQLEIVPAPDGAPVEFQADDVRHAADGGISRAHLWFTIDLQPHERRRFILRRRETDEPPPRMETMRVTALDDSLRIGTARGVVIFGRDGSLRQLPAPGSGWTFPEGLSPAVRIRYPKEHGNSAAELRLGRGSAEPDVAWAAGPLFAKVRVRYPSGRGPGLEQNFLIPREGRELVVTTIIHPGERTDGTVSEHQLLTGALAGPAPEVLSVPAGVRHALRSEHVYDVTALRSASGGALLAIPLVIGGASGRWRAADAGRVSLDGLRGLKHGGEGEQATLRAFWTEVRLVPAADAAPEALWRTYRSRVQPLVAVVDEPALGVDDLHRALQAVVREMKPVGWRQEAGRALVLENPAALAALLRRKPEAGEADVERLIRGARNAAAKLTQDGRRRLREDEKGRAYGGLDPYHITYTQSAAAAVAARADAPPRVAAVNLAMAKAVRAVGGRTDDAGQPYLDCFHRTLNMQLGPVLFGLTAGAAAGDDALVRFYRDLATAPAVQAVFGRGQRPYSSAPARVPEQTDFLYQAIGDFWLRAAELLGGEELGLHPLAYSRFTDCLDVMADVYHGVAARDAAGAPGAARANFFRGQTHTHRWLGWSCAPYLRLLESPAEVNPVGLTEALRHTRAQLGRWKNWPDLTYYVLADLLFRSASRTSAPLPPAPGSVRVNREGVRAIVTWTPTPGAAEYRVYRAARDGGPWRWLNSPYRDPAPAALTGASFVDAASPEATVYRVAAVDAAGRESRWPDDP